MNDDDKNEVLQTMAYTTYNGTSSKADTITYQLIQDAITKVRGKPKLIDDITQVNIQKEVTVEDVFRAIDNEIN